jgi:hypothetical protein
MWGRPKGISKGKSEELREEPPRHEGTKKTRSNNQVWRMMLIALLSTEKWRKMMKREAACREIGAKR